jgi:hypothetical protein
MFPRLQAAEETLLEENNNPRLQLKDRPCGLGFGVDSRSL